ncbi:spermatogenesis-associated protein 31E1-like [Myotis daubentonii]|uniref:spermatogenesis-associated protein 31E1-like n=1 Tax=Myotis daubentonii TaxID=98922 RepID=UPI002873D36E|nr:spermatogenesis-associated protein 31E1-like [Myotis daubentonii]
MRTWASRPQATPSAQLPEGSSTIQMMENPLFSLKSVIATWQNTSPSWVLDTIFGLLCGLLLFLVTVHFWERDQSLPPPTKHRNSRKRSMEPKRRSRSRSRSRSRKKSGILKACRECLQELEEARSLISLLGSHLGRPPEQGGLHQFSCQDSPDEVCKAAPAEAHLPDGAHLPGGEPAEDAAPAISPSASPAPLTLCPLPLASTLSAEHQDQSDLKGTPLGTIVKSSPPSNSIVALPNRAISRVGRSSCPLPALSWWQEAARALYLSTSSQRKSQREHLSHHPPKASFRGGPTDRQVEPGSLSFVNPGVQRLLEILLTKRAELKMWKEKEKEGSLSKQMVPECHLRSLGSMWKSLGAEQDTPTPQPFWSLRDKQEQVPGPQQLSHIKFLEEHLQQKCSQLFWGLPSLHSESLVATAWRDFIRPNLQKLHLQKRLVEDEQRGGLHFKVQVSLELRQPQGQIPQVCQVQDKQGPLHLSVFASKSSQDPQKMESRHQRKSQGKGQPREDFSRCLQQCRRKRSPKGFSRDSATFVVKALGISSKKKSERDLKPSKSDSGTCLPRSTDQNHLVRKSEQIDQDLDPLRVDQPWLADNHSFPKGNTHMETRNLATSESREHYVNTSCELSFLSPSTRQMLEEHFLKFQVRCECGLSLQAFEPINLKLHEAQYLHLPQSPLPSSAACVPEVHSKAKFTKALGKPPQAFSEEVITKESGRLPTTSVNASKSSQGSFEKSQKSIEGTLSGSGHGLSEAPRIKKENRPSSQSLTPILHGKTQQNRTAMDVKKKSPKSNPSSTIARKEAKQEKGTQTPEDPCQRPAILEKKVSSHSSRAEESRKAEEAEMDPAWEVIVGPSVLGNIQTTNTEMKRSGSPGPIQRSSPLANSVAQDLKEPCLTTKMASKFELQGKVEPGSQLPGHAPGLLLPDCYSDVLLQDYTTGMLIQDDVTNVLLQDPHTDVLLAADLLASHWALCGSQGKKTSGDMPAAQGPYNLIWSRQSSQGQQAPGISKVKAPWQSQRKMLVPTDQREDKRRPKPGQHKEGLAERRTSQARGMSHPPQVRGKGDTLRRKYLQRLPEEELVFVECNCTKKMRHSLQDKGPKDPLQKGLPASAIGRSQEPVKSRSCVDTRPVEAQAIMTAVGQILVEKLACHQELHAQEFN